MTAGFGVGEDGGEGGPDQSCEKGTRRAALGARDGVDVDVAGAADGIPETIA